MAELVKAVNKETKQAFWTTANIIENDDKLDYAPSEKARIQVKEPAQKAGK